MLISKKLMLKYPLPLLIWSPEWIATHATYVTLVCIKNADCKPHIKHRQTDRLTDIRMNGQTDRQICLLARDKNITSSSYSVTHKMPTSLKELIKLKD